MHNITEPKNSLGSTERLARLNYTYLHNYFEYKINKYNSAHTNAQAG